MSEYTLYSLLLALVASLTGTLALVTWRRGRAAPSAYPLSAFFIALTIWSGTYALHWLRVPGLRPFFWLDMTVFGVVMVPATFFVFALRFTNHDRLVTRRLLALLTIGPLFTLVCLWTDEGSGLFFAGTRSAADGAFQTGGPVFWANVAYSYALMLLAFALLAREFRRSPLYRRQVGVVLLGVVLSWALNIFNLSGFNPFAELDPTPFSFAIAGLFCVYSLFRYRLVDVVPIARHKLVDWLSDGVLVLDARDRIVDANPAIEHILGTDPTRLIGQLPRTGLANWSQVVDRYRDVCETRDEIVLEGPVPKYLDLRIMPLKAHNGSYTGRVIVLRDVTDRKNAELALREANDQLQLKLEEVTRLQEQLREQALRDPLTGLFNRRYLEEALALELASTARAHPPVSLVVLDVDNFKRVNDTFGHPAGDRMLRALAQLLTSNTRAGDVVSRYGGEEFVVVLPGSGPGDAARRAEVWREQFARLQVEYGVDMLNTTLSAGIAAYPEHGPTPEKLIHAADEALYTAKQMGRNRVVCAQPDFALVR
ncbi:MAG TPA: diguanylate cyclase [Chloroflexia bacterium]|jgi:diguanylate cyclase (GGDEF)-like protein/PAS domain S-box-containing protein